MPQCLIVTGISFQLLQILASKFPNIRPNAPLLPTETLAGFTETTSREELHVEARTDADMQRHIVMFRQASRESSGQTRRKGDPFTPCSAPMKMRYVWPSPP